MEDETRPGRCEGRCRSAAEVEAVLQYWAPLSSPWDHQDHYLGLGRALTFFYAEASHEGGECGQGLLNLPCDLRCKYRGHRFQDQFHLYVQ